MRDLVRDDVGERAIPGKERRRHESEAAGRRRGPRPLQSSRMEQSGARSSRGEGPNGLRSCNSKRETEAYLVQRLSKRKREKEAGRADVGRYGAPGILHAAVREAGGQKEEVVAAPGVRPRNRLAGGEKLFGLRELQKGKRPNSGVGEIL